MDGCSRSSAGCLEFLPGDMDNGSAISFPDTDIWVMSLDGRLTTKRMTRNGGTRISCDLGGQSDKFSCSAEGLHRHLLGI